MTDACAGQFIDHPADALVPGFLAVLEGEVLLDRVALLSFDLAHGNCGSTAVHSRILLLFSLRGNSA